MAVWPAPLATIQTAPHPEASDEWWMDEPRQHSTGGKERLGSISKQVDRYLRRLLVVGATAVVRHARQYRQKYPWVMKLLGKKPAKLVAVAVANKMARIAWAIMVKAGHDRAPELAAAA